MSELLLTTTQRAEAAMAFPAQGPTLADKFPKHKIVQGELKPLDEIPLFCNPLVIFLANWVLMMASLSCQVTYVSYPHVGMPLALFGISLGSFLFGYVGLHMLLRRWPAPNATAAWTACR